MEHPRARGAWGGFAAGKPANSNGEASAAGETDVPSSIQPDEAVGLGARIAELTGPLDPAALSRWIIPHLAEAGYEPGGWLHSEAPAGERLPAAVLNLVAPRWMPTVWPGCVPRSWPRPTRGQDRTG